MDDDPSCLDIAVFAIEAVEAAPTDLRDRALIVAGRVLEFDPALEGGAGLERARALLDSGQALAAMERIIDAQGRRADAIEVGALHHDVRPTIAGR